MVDILLKTDEQQMFQSFLKGHLACVFYGIGESSAPDLKIPMNVILENYAVVAKNSENTLLFLQAKSER